MMNFIYDILFSLFSELFSLLLSFLGGLLSCHFTTNIKKSYTIGYWYRRRLARNLNKALKQEKKVAVVAMEICLITAKLYSSKIHEQGTGAEEIDQLIKGGQISTQEAFQLLVERIGREPKIDVHTKKYIESLIIQLSKKL
jgi:hypothetical protein